MKKLFTVIILFFLSFISWNAFSQNGDMYENEHGYLIRNVNYLQYFQDREYMDVYLSYNATPEQPFVVLIHGGSFTNGDKREMEELALLLMKNDISCVSINYSLLSKKYFKDNITTTYQQMLQDIWNAIQHIQLKADEWNVRKSNYVLIGDEVGGYLALLAGYNFYTAVESIVAISAITDLRDIGSFDRLALRKGQDRILFTKLVGGEPFKSSKYLSNAYANASPIDQVRDVPTILIHGVKDPIIHYNQSAKLFKFLKEHDVYTKIYTVENGADKLLFDPNHKGHVMNYIINWLKEKN